jgi:hypothetical protein
MCKQATLRRICLDGGRPISAAIALNPDDAPSDLPGTPADLAVLEDRNRLRVDRRGAIEDVSYLKIERGHLRDFGDSAEVVGLLERHDR